MNTVDARKLKKRRMRILDDLATKSKGRHDVKLPLSEIAPTLDVAGLTDGAKFVDKDNPVYEGGSDQAYDFSTLHEEGLIKHTYLDCETTHGKTVYKNPAVKVTPSGLQAVSDARKSWLARGIEKQPMTFVHIIATIVFTVVGWAVGRYLTPASDWPPPPTPAESAEQLNE